MIPAEADSPAWFAQDLGYFRDAGLDVTIDLLSSGSAISAGVLSGAFDIGVASISSLASAHLRGLQLVLFVPGALHVSAKPTSVLAVAYASPIKTAKELNGKTIAIATLHELTQTAVMAWIDKNGGDSKTASFVEMPQSAMATAVAAGRIDAGFISEPFFSQAVSRKEVRFLGPAYDGISPRFMVTGWFGTTSWIERNAATAKAFATALRRSAQWGAANPAASAAIVAKYTKLAPDVIASMNRSTFPAALEASLIQPVIDVSVQYGMMASKFSAEELIAPAFRS